MNLHKHQLYLSEQHSEPFNIWSAIIRIKLIGKSLIMKLGPVNPIVIEFMNQTKCNKSSLFVHLLNTIHFATINRCSFK